MARKIQFKRGLKANLPKLSTAEIAFTTDEKKAYIGDGNENIRLLDQKDKSEITTQLAEKVSKVNGKTPDAEGNVTLEVPQVDTSKLATKQEVQQLSLTFKESYATLEALQTAYPNGDNANHGVLADSMIYTYKNGWVNTGVPLNGTGIINGGVTADKLAVKSATSAKRTVLGSSVRIVCFGAPYLNFDFKNGKLIIPKDTNIYWNKTRYLTLSTEETVVPFSKDSTSQMLFFNTETKVFNFKLSWDLPSVSEDEILIAAVNTNLQTVDCHAPYVINGDTNIIKTSKISYLGKQALYQFGNIDINTKTYSITIPKGLNIVYDNVKYEVPEIVVLKYSEWIFFVALYFDTVTKTFKVRASSDLDKASDSEILIMIIDIAKQKASSNGPYTINGQSNDNPVANIKQFQNSFEDNIRVSAHRGWNTDYPENTLVSYQKAVDEGFVYIEFDVRKTSDGVFVILHDETINRTARNTDGSAIGETLINIADITYEQALAYDFGAWKGHSGVKIPTLEQVLEFCRMKNIRPYTHVKLYDDEDINQIFQLTKRKGLQRKTVWITDGWSNAEKILELDSQAIVGAGATPSNSEIDAIVTLKNTYNNDNVFMDVSWWEMTDELAEYCHTKDLAFGVFTEGYTNHILTAVRRGAISLTVDDKNVLKLLHDNYS